MAVKENDLLQRFIENEKKSKTWTLISVLIFLALAGTTIYFTYKFKQASTQLKIALQRADSLNTVNEINKSSLENTAKTVESLKRQNDSLLAKVAPIAPNEPDITNKKVYTVFIQYIAGYEEESKAVLLLLQRRKYNAPGRELMKRPNFWSCVKYFNDVDSTEAQRIAALINSNLERFAAKPIRLLRSPINVPPGQLEVWLGEVKRLNTEQLILKYEK